MSIPCDKQFTPGQTQLKSGTSEMLNFSPQIAGNTFHFYGFSTEQVFNNTWTSGADWTTAAWSVAQPNAAGANADFTAQGAPTTINLDAARTVGHVRFAGTNAWTISGANPLTLQADVGGVSVLGATSGTHTISTAMTLNSDVLKTGAGAVVLSGAITDNGKNVTLGAGTLEIANAAAQAMSGIFSGGGNLTKSGAGTLTLSAANTYTGPTTINAGTLAINGGSAIVDTGAVTIANTAGATLLLNASETIGSLAGGGTGGEVLLGANTLTVGDATSTIFAGTILGSGGISKAGAGTLTLTGNNTFTGGTSISNGTLLVSGGGRLADTGTVNLTSSNSVFSIVGLNVASEKIASLDGVANSIVQLGSLTMELGIGAGEFSGNVEGTGGSVTKSGTGTQKLSGNNTYSGSTNVSGGTLLLGSNTALSGAAALNLSGGTLNTAGFSPSTGALSVTSGSVLDLGAPGGTSLLSFANVGTWTGVLSIWNYTGTAWTSGSDQLTFASGAGGIDLSKVTFYSDSGSTLLSTGGGLLPYGGGSELVPVPEANSVLCGLLLLGAVGYRELRRARV